MSPSQALATLLTAQAIRKYGLTEFLEMRNDILDFMRATIDEGDPAGRHPAICDLVYQARHLPKEPTQ